MLSLLLNLAIIAGAIIWASCDYRSYLLVLQWAMVRMIFALLLVMLAGAIQMVAPPWCAEVHRWGAHLLVVVAWVLMMATIASACAWRSGESIVSRLAATGVAMLMIVMLIATSFAGYLYPHDQMSDPELRVAAQATVNRFYVLHGAILPLVALLTSAASLALVSRRLAMADSGRQQFGAFPGADEEHLVEQGLHQP